MGDTQVGWRHFAAAEWAEARDSFSAVLAEAPGDPDALDGLGQSLWWLGEREAGIDSRREAYAAFRRRGDLCAAAGLAVYLAGEHRIDGQPSAAAGWLARARRLLDGTGTVGELGWLRIEEAKRSHDPVAAERFAREALAVAHELASPDIECMALAQLGRAVVAQGRVEEGVGYLDEAMTVALGGETSDPLACTTRAARRSSSAMVSPTSSGPRNGARRSSTSPSAAGSLRCSRGVARSSEPCSCVPANGRAPSRC